MSLASIGLGRVACIGCPYPSLQEFLSPPLCCLSDSLLQEWPALKLARTSVIACVFAVTLCHGLSCRVSSRGQIFSAITSLICIIDPA